MATSLQGLLHTNRDFRFNVTTNAENTTHPAAARVRGERHEIDGRMPIQTTRSNSARSAGNKVTLHDAVKRNFLRKSSANDQQHLIPQNV
ncbi:hypothetical protein BTUL_0046g00140 [Botrytis tulipae]|uniref:Uncharacterized protein n=1 Tax=Botrytis tulipae TaxID=87230 RepID=A0A4Z1ERL9_9HELO|nr:hypothetical protein BTUL_0046g00140 [Botrytis tulipae]